MIDVVIAMLLQAAPQAPPTAPAQPPSAAAETKPPVKLICRREFETGSRVKTLKVCHSPEDPEQNEDKTTLQRALDKQADIVPPPPTFGN